MFNSYTDNNYKSNSLIWHIHTLYDFKYLPLILSVQFIDKLKEGRTCLNKASVLSISIKYPHVFGDAFLKNCIVSEIYATVFKVLFMLFYRTKKLYGLRARETKTRISRTSFSPDWKENPVFSSNHSPHCEQTTLWEYIQNE